MTFQMPIKKVAIFLGVTLSQFHINRTLEYDVDRQMARSLQSIYYPVMSTEPKITFKIPPPQHRATVVKRPYMQRQFFFLAIHQNSVRPPPYYNSRKFPIAKKYFREKVLTINFSNKKKNPANCNQFLFLRNKYSKNHHHGPPGKTKTFSFFLRTEILECNLL